MKTKNDQKKHSISNVRLQVRRPELKYSLVILVSIIIPLLLSLTLRGIDWWIIDFFSRCKHNQSHVDEQVAAVLIDDEVVNRLHGWPITKSVYEELALYLIEMGASSVVFDILFTDDLTCGDTSDASFLNTVNTNQNIIFPWLAITTHHGVENDPALSDLDRFTAGTSDCRDLTVIAGGQFPYQRLLTNIHHAGFLNRGSPYPDNVERRMPLIASINGNSLQPSLALASVMSTEGIHNISWDKSTNKLHFKNQWIPCDQRGEMLLDFSKEVPTYSLSDLQHSMEQWAITGKSEKDSAAFKGRIVFIGNGSRSLHDFGVTPLSRKESSPFTANVLLHARSVSTILSGSAPYCIPFAIVVCIMTLLALCLYFFRMIIEKQKRFLFIAVPLILLPFFSAYLLYMNGIIMFPLPIALVAVLFIISDFIAANGFNTYPADAPKAYKGNKSFVFISYTRKELKEASHTMFLLQNMGYRIWYDRAIEPGEKWKQVIETKIKQSSAIVFIASYKALNSTEVQDELNKARLAEKKNISICIDHSYYNAIYKGDDVVHTISKDVLKYCHDSQICDFHDKQLKVRLKESLQMYFT